MQAVSRVVDPKTLALETNGANAPPLEDLVRDRSQPESERMLVSVWYPKPYNSKP
jgi:hypothetical protein